MNTRESRDAHQPLRARAQPLRARDQLAEGLLLGVRAPRRPAVRYLSTGQRGGTRRLIGTQRLSAYAYADRYAQAVSLRINTLIGTQRLSANAMPAASARERRT
eukprot:1743359-Rhodomonas_salina.1